MRPNGILLDYGGTLVDEISFDARAGTLALLELAAYRPPSLSVEDVLSRARFVSDQVTERRDVFGIETPWPAVSRLVYDFLGVRFELASTVLELAFWKASVATAPIKGVHEALSEFDRNGIRTAVVSNCSFGPEVIRYELEKHGLAKHLAFVMVSAEYAVRKPNVLLFETAAARLRCPPEEIWFVGDRLDTDMAGARAAGMKPIWLRGQHSGPAGDVHFVADSWREIEDLFRRTWVSGPAGGSDL